MAPAESKVTTRILSAPEGGSGVSLALGEGVFVGHVMRGYDRGSDRIWGRERLPSFHVPSVLLHAEWYLGRS